MVRNNRKGAPTHTRLLRSVNVWRVRNVRWAPTPRKIRASTRPRAPPEFNFQLDLSGRHRQEKDSWSPFRAVRPERRTGSVSRQVDSFVSLFTTRRPKRVRMVPRCEKSMYSASTIRYEELTIPWYSTTLSRAALERFCFSFREMWYKREKHCERSFEIQESSRRPYRFEIFAGIEMLETIICHTTRSIYDWPKEFDHFLHFIYGKNPLNARRNSL